jgi:hypothetical protein
MSNEFNVFISIIQIWGLKILSSYKIVFIIHQSFLLKYFNFNKVLKFAVTMRRITMKKSPVTVLLVTFQGPKMKKETQSVKSLKLKKQKETQSVKLNTKKEKTFVKVLKKKRN